MYVFLKLSSLIPINGLWWWFFLLTFWFAQILGASFLGTVCFPLEAGIGEYMRFEADKSGGEVMLDTFYRSYLSITTLWGCGNVGEVINKCNIGL